MYAPEFPGTGAADPYAIHQLDDLRDVILAYEQALPGRPGRFRRVERVACR